MRIGAAMIVKNEERCLGRCLASIRDLVDEIVIVDTGSTDRSVEIAEQFGAHVLYREWDGDFSAARNVSLDAVTSDLILYIDADEYLVEGDRAAVARAVAEGGGRHVAFRLGLRHRPGFTPLREYRMWVNRPDIRFEGVMHESIVPAFRTIVLSEGLSIGMVDLLLDHDGYEGDQSAKHARNLPLLKAQLQNDPKRTYLWDHIGRIYSELDRLDEARDAFGRGVELVRTNGILDPADALVYFDLIFLNATSEMPDAALTAEGAALFPRHALVQWACALDSLARKSWSDVVGFIDTLMTISVAEMADGAIGINARIQSEWAPHVRGMARFALGDYGGAAEDFATAERAEPLSLSYRAKRMLAEAHERRRA